jgi:hypothetical protein
MSTPLRQRDQALFLTSLLVAIWSSGCTSGTDRARTGSASSTETVATVPAESTSSESTMTPSDDKRPAPSESNAPTPAAAAQKAETPPAPTKLPRPSIDPGRVPAKPARPAPAPRPADSAPSAPIDSPATPPATAAAPASGQSQWLKYDAGSNTVTFELVAGPFNWNGFSSGGATLALPPKANVVINFVNKDGTPHSAEVISGEDPLPNAAVDPAIPRAYTNKVLEGLPQEASDAMRFTVPESGKYRIFCGVPGHGLSGMWIWMRVDPGTKAPSFGPTKG